MWGEDSLDDDYQSISSSSDKRTTRVKKRVSGKELARRVKIDTLVEICNDLGTMKWVGADESWDSVIKAVRKNLFKKAKRIMKGSDIIDLEHPITIHYKDKK